MITEFQKRIISSLFLIPIALFFIIKGSNSFIFFLLIFFLINSYEWLKMTKNKILLLIGFIFLFLSTYSAYLIRGSDDSNLLIFLLVILICVSTDIGGYVCGKIFKGPKLIKISPNKTYSGMLGSYLFSIIFVKIYIYYFNLIEVPNIYVLTFLISSISQIGDIIISYFKRISKIKDTGIILPGHGGLLDRTDGMIFAIPFYFIFYNL